MPPKSLPVEAKRALIVQWIQTSGTAHTSKDLEKALPAVASCNSMQVKEHIQALTDENLILVEKIGSGNWYWSFPSDVQLRKEQALGKAQEENDKATTALAELQRKVDEATAERNDDDDEHGDGGSDRKTLTFRQATLGKEVEKLRTELAAFSENDPVEFERRNERLLQLQRDTQRWTDQILSMESWIKAQAGGDKEQFLLMKRNWYGAEFDEEEGALKEL